MAPLLLDESFYLSGDESCIDTTIELKNQSQDHATSIIMNKETHYNKRTKEDDAFLYYSNDEIWLKTLKLEEVDDTAASKTSRQERKTRLSFEIDPLLVLGDDILDELYDDDQEESDIDFSQLMKNDDQSSHTSQLNLLAGLLQ